MLLLGLNVGNERYGIEASRVIEIVPLVPLKKVPLSDTSIKGLFNYRGITTPVVDLCQLFEKRDCEDSLSSRILITEYTSVSGHSRTIGLIAEQIIDVFECTPEEIENSGIDQGQNGFLRQTYKHDGEIIQLLDAHKILPESIRNQLVTDIN